MAGEYSGYAGSLSSCWSKPSYFCTKRHSMSALSCPVHLTTRLLVESITVLLVYLPNCKNDPATARSFLL